MNRVVLVHGWNGSPNENWFPWLKKELEAKGFEVIAPQLPDTANPRIQKWVPALAAAVGEVNEETYFVGHSMGCQAIVWYLEGLPKAAKVGGAVFVAGFFKRLTGLKDEPGFSEIEEHWLGTPLDFVKSKSHLPKSVAIFSDNDPYVPLDNKDDFKDNLGCEIIVEHNMKHFGKAAGITELPIVLEKILELAK